MRLEILQFLILILVPVRTGTSSISVGTSITARLPYSFKREKIMTSFLHILVNR
jgi:hypothetical protein